MITPMEYKEPKRYEIKYKSKLVVMLLIFQIKKML